MGIQNLLAVHYDYIRLHKDAALYTSFLAIIKHISFTLVYTHFF